MKRKVILAVSISLLLLLVAGTVLAASTVEAPRGGYEMTWNSLMGGGAGGGSASSPSYQVTVSFGGTVQTSASSASYEMCSGFLCYLKSGLAQLGDLFLPVMKR